MAGMKRVSRSGFRVLRQPVKLCRERKIFFGQPALIVRRERERDLVPADINVGMMPCLFGEHGNPVDELDGGGKIFERERARNDGGSFLPQGNFDERPFDLRCVELRHGGRVRLLVPSCKWRVAERHALPSS